MRIRRKVPARHRALSHGVLGVPEAMQKIRVVGICCDGTLTTVTVQSGGYLREYLVPVGWNGQDLRGCKLRSESEMVR